MLAHVRRAWRSVRPRTGRGMTVRRDEHIRRHLMLTADMKAIVDSSKLGFVATVCADGSPNLSPKGSIRVYDEDHLVFADIASPATVENLRGDPRIEINCVDFLRRRGYRFKGTAQVIEPGDNPVYREIAGWLREGAGGAGAGGDGGGGGGVAPATGAASHVHFRLPTSQLPPRSA